MATPPTSDGPGLPRDASPTGDPVTALAGFATDLARAPDLDAAFRLLVAGAARLLGTDAVSVALRVRGGWSTPASTLPLARAADEAQYAVGEGPCLEALDRGSPSVLEDLRLDDRWPRWQDQARQLGVRAVTSMPLAIGDRPLGALNLYAPRPGRVLRAPDTHAEAFATHAALALRSTATAASLRTALATRDVIGQAKGILMEREGVTADEAFARLRDLSNRENRKLRELAASLAETRQLPTDGPVARGGAGTRGSEPPRAR